MRNLFKIIALTLVVMLPNIAFSSENIIKNIEFEGNKRIEATAIRNHLDFHVNDHFDDHKLNNSIKRLYQTGLFSNIDISYDHGTLLVHVKENPLINMIVFEGNKNLKKDDLMRELSLKERSIYSQTRLQQDVISISNLYKKSGRYAAQITPKIIELSQNRINVVYEINEGNKTPIKKLFFVGNKKFSDSRLASIINTKEAAWFRFLSTSDSFDPDRLEADKELLRRFYNASGYPDFKVVSATAELSPNRDAFVVTYSLEEGDKYDFGTIDVENNLSADNFSDLKKEIYTKSKNTYNVEEIEATMDSLIKKMNQEGFPFVTVDPLIEQDTEDHLVSIRYTINEGQKLYLSKINITGNSRTHDNVIRREFRVAEGEPYNQALVNRSEQRIKNLDYFEKVELATIQSDVPDEVDVNVKVIEKSTAKINFGVGYSTLDSAIGNIALTEDNFLGRGQKLGVSLEKAQRRFDINLNFTEPYFMNKEVEVGFDVFRLSSERQAHVNPYSNSTFGGMLRSGYSISEYINHAQRYTLKRDHISDIKPDASIYIQEQEGRHTTSSIGQSFALDKTDSRIDPKKGFFAKLDQEYAGLGGNSNYIKHELNVKYFIPLRKEDFVFALGGNVGHVNRISKDVRINERFYVGDIGAYGLRGFGPGGIGPRVQNADRRKQDPLGGNTFYTATASVNFPIGLPDELDVSGSIFTDIGSLFGIDDRNNKSNTKYWNDNSMRMSAGAGIVWASAVGPIRLDFAYPILKKKYDVKQYFHINFSSFL